MLKFNLDKKKINIYAYTYIYICTHISSSMHECLQAFIFTIQEAKMAFLVIESNLNWPSNKVPRQSDAWRYFSLGENPDTTSQDLNGQHKYPSLPKGCFWVSTPSLNQRVRHCWIFSQHTTLLLWLTFKVRTSG